MFFSEHIYRLASFLAKKSAPLLISVLSIRVSIHTRSVNIGRWRGYVHRQIATRSVPLFYRRIIVIYAALFIDWGISFVLAASHHVHRHWVHVHQLCCVCRGAHWVVLRALGRRRPDKALTIYVAGYLHFRPRSHLLRFARKIRLRHMRKVIRWGHMSVLRCWHAHTTHFVDIS